MSDISIQPERNVKIYGSIEDGLAELVDSAITRDNKIEPTKEMSSFHGFFPAYLVFAGRRNYVVFISENEPMNLDETTVTLTELSHAEKFLKAYHPEITLFDKCRFAYSEDGGNQIALVKPSLSGLLGFYDMEVPSSKTHRKIRKMARKKFAEYMLSLLENTKKAWDDGKLLTPNINPEFLVLSGGAVMNIDTVNLAAYGTSTTPGDKLIEQIKTNFKEKHFGYYEGMKVARLLRSLKSAFPAYFSKTSTL